MTQRPTTTLTARLGDAELEAFERVWDMTSLARIRPVGHNPGGEVVLSGKHTVQVERNFSRLVAARTDLGRAEV